MKTMSISYLWSILKKRQSFFPDESLTTSGKGSRRTSPQNDKKGRNATPSTRKEQDANIEHISEPEAEYVATPAKLTMPLGEAEKVIAEYATVQKELADKQEPSIPVALSELYEKMAAREEELLNGYMDSLPKNEYGEPDFNNAPNLDDFENGMLPLEDYLRLKFPEAEEEELHRDYRGHVGEDYSENPEFKRIEQAFEIDRACSLCISPEGCLLPQGSKQGAPKPEAVLFTSEDDKKFLGTEFNGCIKCKHKKRKEGEKSLEQKRQEADFKHRVKASGLTQSQIEQTFETYQHEGTTPDIIIAKAQAIIAAKTQRNLVLAGKVGTGKTHLAIAIAIEAIKSGRQAIIASVSELLDEIKTANMEHKDSFGLMAKYKKVTCLVLDDWGKERVTNTTMSYLFEIVDYRYRHGLQTIVTTNKPTVEALETRWDKDFVRPIASRLLENGEWVVINQADDYRVRKRG